MLIIKYQITREVSGTIAASAKIQYLLTPVCGKALHHINVMSVDVGSNTTDHLNHIVLDLVMHFLNEEAMQNKSKTLLFLYD